jgi:hypothetical protein
MDPATVRQSRVALPEHHQSRLVLADQPRQIIAPVGIDGEHPGDRLEFAGDAGRAGGVKVGDQDQGLFGHGGGPLDGGTPFRERIGSGWPVVNRGPANRPPAFHAQPAPPARPAAISIVA